MNILKKILITALFFDSMVSFATDDRKDLERKSKKESLQSIESNRNSTAIWAGIAGAAVGMVAGAAISSWLSELDTPESVEYVSSCVSYDVDLHEYQNQSPKARQIKQQLDALRRYGQSFDLYENEQGVIAILNKLGVRLYQIDTDFYAQLESDYKTLSDIGYSIWWHSIKDLEAQKNLYLANSYKIVSFFRRHYTFIQACQIINSYNQLSNGSFDIVNLVYMQARHNQQYPLIDYKNKIESDAKILNSLQYSRLYPVLTQKIQIICNFLDCVVQSIYRSNEYQHQVMQKKQDELMVEFNRIEQEKLDIARKQIKLQEETNRIMAEKNRIEADKFFRDRE